MTARRSNRSSVEPLAQGLDGLQLVPDGVEIAGLDALDESLQVLADVARDRIAASQEGPGAAAVFRRRRALPADTDRIGSLRLHGSRRSTRTSCCHESPKSYS